MGILGILQRSLSDSGHAPQGTVAQEQAYRRDTPYEKDAENVHRPESRFESRGFSSQARSHGTFPLPCELPAKRWTG